MQLNLPNGIVLDDGEGLAPELTAYASDRNVKCRIFHSTLTNGYREYVIVVGQDVVYNNQSAEAIYARITMMSLANETDKE